MANLYRYPLHKLSVQPTIVMALPIESQGLFEKSGVDIQYTGIGKINAAMKATELILNGAKFIINMGSAGSPKFKTHALIECAGFAQHDMDVSPLGFEIGETPMDEIKSLILAEQRLLETAEHGICGTGDHFVTGQSKVACDLFDMEAYAIAKVCKKFQVPFASIKFVSDGADHTAHQDWQVSLEEGARVLMNAYREITRS